MPKVLIEACVESLDGAMAAEAGGAGRVELCAGLDSGGLTPADAVVRACSRRLGIPVFVLVRPRPGSFTISRAELELHERQIRRATELGAAGIVAGALTPIRTIDRPALAALLRAAAPLPLTFHRAFDEIADQFSALDQLIELGVTRVLTSGGAVTAAEGSTRIRVLHARAAGRIVILAGGSVRRHNAGALVRSTGVDEVHSRTPTDPEQVRALVTEANAVRSVS